MLSCSKYLELHHDEIEVLIDLQKQIMNLNTTNFDEIKEMILNSIFIQEKKEFIQILNTIQVGIAVRPLSFELYFNLLASISPQIKANFSDKQIISIFPKRSSILKLFEKGIISIESIYEQCRLHKSNLIYFAPEMKEYDNNYFESNTDQELRASLNFDEMKKYRSKGNNPQTVAEYIRNDDLERFQNFLSKTNTKIDVTLFPSEYEQCRFLSQNMNFVDYSAFHGSINIFKFLILNKCRLTNRTSQFAVAGGSYDIVHILEDNKCSFRSCLDVSIRFHQNEITEYLIENHRDECKMNFSSFCASVEMYNAQIFYQNIEKFILTDLESINSSILTLSAIHGILDIVHFFCSVEEFNVDENSYIAFHFLFVFLIEPALILAANSGHYEIVKELCKIKSLNVNTRNIVLLNLYL